MNHTKLGTALLFLAAGAACDSPDFNPLEPPVINIPPPKVAPTLIPKINALAATTLPFDVVIRDNGSFDPDGTIAKFIVAGPDGVKQEFTRADFTYTFRITQNGTYSFLVVAVDNDGLGSPTFSYAVTVKEEKPVDFGGPVTRVRLKDSVSFFRNLPAVVCAEDAGSASRDSAAIRTIHWQTSLGDQAEGMEACFTARNEGAFFVQAEAEDVLGRLGNVKFLTVTVDTSKTRVDTVVVRDTLVVKIKHRRPVAQGRIVGPDTRFVGETICTEDTGSFSPDGLRTVERVWIRQDGSKTDGNSACYTPANPGPLLFVYYVVDEEGNVSIPLPLAIVIHERAVPPPSPQCVPNPAVDLAAGEIEIGLHLAGSSVKNSSANCSYRVLIATYGAELDGSVKNLHSLFDADVVLLGPGQTLHLSAVHPSCDYWAVVAHGDLLANPGPAFELYGGRIIRKLHVGHNACPPPSNP